MFATGGLASLCVVVSLVIMIIYVVKEGASDSHVILSVVGYFLFMVGTLWGRFSYVSPVCYVIGVFCVLFGTIMHLKRNGFTSSLHSWLGIVAFVLIIVCTVCVILFNWVLKLAMANYIIFACTRLAIVLYAITLITGMFEEKYKEWGPRWLFYLHLVIVIIYSLMMFVAFFF